MKKSLILASVFVLVLAFTAFAYETGDGENAPDAAVLLDSSIDWGTNPFQVEDNMTADGEDAPDSQLLLDSAIEAGPNNTFSDVDYAF